MARRTELTDAQINTLRRMNSGTRYFMRGDVKKGDEDTGCRRIDCRSLPVLFRAGLVAFCSNCEKIRTLWYSVDLTPAGRDALIGAKTKLERGL